MRRETPAAEPVTFTPVRTPGRSGPKSRGIDVVLVSDERLVACAGVRGTLPAGRRFEDSGLCRRTQSCENRSLVHLSVGDECNPERFLILRILSARDQMQTDRQHRCNVVGLRKRYSQAGTPQPKLNILYHFGPYEGCESGGKRIEENGSMTIRKTCEQP